MSRMQTLESVFDGPLPCLLDKRRRRGAEGEEALDAARLGLVRRDARHEAARDEQLRTAWVNSGTDISALWKTPVGPVLIINLILWATGASWCDTPLGVAEACMGR